MLPRANPEETPYLQLLPPEVRRLVVSSMVPVRAAQGEDLVREGDDADGWYVLLDGAARVIRRVGAADVELGLLRAGDSFGEAALLGGGRRAATVRAVSPVELVRLERAVFLALCEQYPTLRSAAEWVERSRAVHNFLEQYHAAHRLPPEAQQELLAALRPVSAAAGEVLIREGEPPGPMYVVRSGRLRVWTERGGRHDLAFLRRGDYFGERSALTGQPRAATVEAVGAVSLLALSPEAVHDLSARYPAFRTALDERIASYDYRTTARVPLDLAAELLPAEAQPEEDPEEEAGADPAGPFADARGRFVKRDRRLGRVPVVRQIDEMDCGAACLATITRLYGRRVALSRVRGLARTTRHGTTLRGLCEAAEALGLAARGVRVPVELLDEMPLPAIVHWRGNHWLVLVDVRPEHVRVMDPAVGVRRYGRDEFAAGWTGIAALFDYTDRLELAPEERTSWAWLLPMARPYAGTLALSVGLALGVSAIEMISPVLTQVIFDRVLVDQDQSLLRLVMFGLAGVLGFSVLASLLQRYLMAWVAVRFDAAAFDAVTRRLLSLPVAYFLSRRTGDIQRRMGGLRKIREFVVQNAVRVLTSTAQLATVAALMLAYSPRLAGVFAITLPLYAGLMRWSERALQPTWTRLEEALGRYESGQVDAIKGMETVKALGAEPVFRSTALNRFLDLGQERFRADFTMMSYESAVRSVGLLTQALFLYFGAREVLEGRLTAGGLVAFSALVGLGTAPLQTMLGVWDGLQLTGVLLQRLEDVIAQEPEQGADHSHLRPVRSLSGEVTLSDVVVQFGGPGSTRVLDGVSLHVPAGTRVAVVGRSGSGKTTLIKCLVGLIEPTSGAITYDGVDMRAVSWRGLRRQMGFVLQDNYLFDDTIAANIAFGDPDPDMDRVLRVARLAEAHAFIERLPLGYQTRVGESGLTLSGGQKQRIALARALYLDPPILLLDEATSALDSESERAIQGNLAELQRGRTSFVIAHRLSTVRDADLIVVLERGRIVEQGSHDALMEARGLYFYLVSQQLGS